MPFYTDRMILIEGQLPVAKNSFYSKHLIGVIRLRESTQIRNYNILNTFPYTFFIRIQKISMCNANRTQVYFQDHIALFYMIVYHDLAILSIHSNIKKMFALCSIYAWDDEVVLLTEELISSLSILLCFIACW